MKVEVTRTTRRIVKMRLENGVLKVVANCFLSDKKLRQIIAENADWINAQKTSKTVTEQPEQTVSASNTRPQPAAPSREGTLLGEVYDGRKTVIFGEVITVCPGESAKTYLDENVLYIARKNYDTRELRVKSIKSYLKRIATTYVSNEVANFGSDVSLCPAKIEFRDNSDFWVKCSLASQRVLCFDYRIVQLPQKLRRYIIAHGFAHFAHPLHDEYFWNFLSNTLPRYKDYVKELEQYRVLKNI